VTAVKVKSFGAPPAEPGVYLIKLKNRYNSGFLINAKYLNILATT
jgi:hypothetical protein